MKVSEPVDVRYAWAAHPKATLVGAGSNGLPAAPFRTDKRPWREAQNVLKETAPTP